MNDATDDLPQAPRRPRHLMDPNAPQRDTINSAGTTRVQKWVMSTLVVTTILHLAGGLLVAAWFIEPDQPGIGARQASSHPHVFRHDCSTLGYVTVSLLYRFLRENRRRLTAGERYGDTEDRPFARPGPDCQGMPQQTAYAIGNGQAQPKPLNRLLPLLRQAHELTKDFFMLIIRNSRPCIPNINTDTAIFTPAPKQNSTTVGVTNSVG